MSKNLQNVKTSLPKSNKPACLLIYTCRWPSLNNSRVDVLSDQYLDASIKDATCANRAGTSQPIRRKVVRLPQNWQKFISHPSNKSKLASFLSTELKSKSAELPPGSELVLGGSFKDIWSSSSRK
jgi:hypothetical protein